MTEKEVTELLFSETKFEINSAIAFRYIHQVIKNQFRDFGLLIDENLVYPNEIGDLKLLIVNRRDDTQSVNIHYYKWDSKSDYFNPKEIPKIIYRGDVENLPFYSQIKNKYPMINVNAFRDYDEVDKSPTVNPNSKRYHLLLGTDYNHNSFQWRRNDEEIPDNLKNLEPIFKNLLNDLKRYESKKE